MRSINWFTVLSLFVLAGLTLITLLSVMELEQPYESIVGVTGLGAMAITLAVLSLHFKDD